MESTLFLLALGGAVGAVLLYRCFARTKEASENMVNEYGKLLVEARQRMVAAQDDDGGAPEAEARSDATKSAEPPVY